MHICSVYCFYDAEQIFHRFLFDDEGGPVSAQRRVYELRAGQLTVHD